MKNGEVILFAGDLTADGLVATVSALSRGGVAIYVQGAMTIGKEARRRVTAAARGTILFDDA
ncbi:MAG TPA: hypothetical protein VEJ16_09040 [Alphaproteobacteria bacterium]|nr:hypothetical protein [Alphaproteobacteria bacterium]